MDYAQPRLQARYAALGDEAFWSRLHAIRDFVPAWQAVQSSELARWIAGIDAASGPHAIELGLRARLRESIRTVASWMPDAWRPAVQWCLQLIDLPALLSLARGEAPLAWMARDPELRAFATADPESRVAELRRGPLAFLDPVWDDVSRTPPSGLGPQPALSSALLAWADEWRRHWPSRHEESIAAMRELERLVRRELARFASADSRETDSLRRGLVRHLQALFRRATLLPAAGFAYLALVAIEALRLRGELIARSALGDAGAST
jgi:hypothetical protein